MISRATIAWLLLGLIWGTNFVLIKWSTEIVAPSQVAFVRVLVGFLTVGLYAAIKKQLKFSHLKYSIHFLVMSCLAAALYFYGFAEGTALLQSGLAGAVSAAIPLFSLMAAVIFLPSEKLTLQRIGGLLSGLIGVLMIAKPFAGDLGDNLFLGVLWMTLGSFSLGVSFVYARKFITPLMFPAAALTTYQLGFGAILLFAVTDTGGLLELSENKNAIWILFVGLGVIGTGFAYVLYYYIIEKLGAVRASALTYVPPVVALFLGATLLKEAITIIDYVATILIFAGVVLVNKKSTNHSVSE